MTEMVWRVAEALMAASDVDMGDFKLKHYYRFARVAIAAMREPTEQMLDAGWPHTADPCWKENLAEAWKAMVDAVLEKPA